MSNACVETAPEMTGQVRTMNSGHQDDQDFDRHPVGGGKYARYPQGCPIEGHEGYGCNCSQVKTAHR